MKFFSEHIKGDKVVWIIVLLLSLFSILSVYSSTGSLAFRYQGGNTEYYLLKHVFTIVTGLFIMYLIHNIKYTRFSRIAQLLFILSIPLLFYTLVKGTNVNDASRWLTIPFIGISFQSSDLAKLAVILFLARSLALKQDKIDDFRNSFVPIIWPIALVTVLIFPANLSTAVLVFGTAMIIMFIGRVPIKYIGAALGILIVIGALAVLIIMQSPGKGRTGTWANRIESFFSDEEDEGDYQALQSKIAIANGGITGKLPGNSTQRNFLPHPYSDFIYALLVEEWGLFGGIFVLLLYLILLYRGIRIATRSPGSFGAFLSIGLTIMIVFQALINMGVAVNLLPVTGQPLPMVSMGGTSIWFTCISLGIILSVSRNKEEEEKKEISNENTKA
ncbi:MAG: cell division protein FtsW [Bacteroidetes bacterium GWF2_43_63]|nr:MAG: cell division protein FtsW [Bacteroidetes bacterium GWE2_42_42]OFY55247.1 MAG: cell division protein FtsW [Bacteroidetes bacterium GWF2_43_63]HBG70870.1 cell division protein FtsW [Bacteroidales bacterium]HCB63366.1 cell division protein FtsW [Bacteroidales bacterium]HCY23069.1 cell division protein FtsW [Bacteroidales bacterium]